MPNIVNFKYEYNEDGTFDVKFNSINREPMDWQQEVYNTANLIADSTNKPILLCMSGGIDSEVVARAFLENRIPFTALSLNHTRGTNLHDIDFAVNFCKNNNIRHTLVDFDFEEFLRNKIPSYIKNGYVTWRAFRCQQLYLFELADSIGATAVLGGGPSPFFTVNGEACLNFKRDELMCLEWLRRNDKEHYPYFFWHNPELMASYFKQGLIDFLLRDPTYFVNSWPTVSYEKMTVYHKYWPNMPRRRKYDGFETIRKTEWARILHDPIRAVVGEIPEKYISVSIIKKQLGI